MGKIFTGSIVVSLLLIIAGGIGLVFGFVNFTVGSTALVQCLITYGTFTTIGIIILVLLMIVGPEFE